MGQTRAMNLAPVLLGIGDRPPDSPALVHEGVTTSYGDLTAQVQAVAGGLVGRGVRPGERVALVMANEPAFVVSYLATLWVGAIAVPLNPTGAPPELAHELRDVDARVAIVGDAGAGTFVASGASTPSVAAGTTLAGGDATGWDELSSAEPLGDAMERPEDEVAVLLYTAGTAGHPKAAMLTHGNLASNIRQIQGHAGLHVAPDDVGLAVLPFFHIFGLNVGLGVSMAAGACQVLVPDFDPEGSLELLRASGTTVVAGVPAMWEAWYEVAAVPDDTFASVRRAFSGAAPLAPELAAGLHDRFGLRLYEGYGLTEASPVVTTSGVDGEPRAGSVGPPLPGVDVRLVDAEGHDVLAGDPGEIWVRGPNVFVGYWHDPKATARVLTEDGWLRTGDIAVVDDDGWLSLVDRVKDLVIVSGFNVFPAEVEDVLCEHPAVAEAAIVGVPDERTGEAVAAFVVTEPDQTVGADELRAFCGTRLARYKLPSVVEVVDDLPRNLAGKVLRRALRDRVAAPDDPAAATRKPA